MIKPAFFGLFLLFLGYSALADNLLSRESIINIAVRNATGAQFDIVSILRYQPDILQNAYVIRFVTSHWSTSEIIVYNVTSENLDQKTDEIIRVAIADLKDRAAYEAQGREMVRSILSMQQAENAAVSNAVGATIGAPPYFSVWSEIPVSPKSNKFLEFGHSQWLRTTLTVDGILNNPTSNANSESPVLVTRLSTSIWGFSGASEVGAGFMRFGVLSGSVRLSRTENAAGRIDFDLFSGSYVLATAESYKVRPFMTYAFSAGLRFFDQYRSAVFMHFKQNFRVGLIFLNRFFIAAKAGTDDAQASAGYFFAGSEIGWKPSKLMTIKWGVDYNQETKSLFDSNGNTRYDPMYLVPKGWNFNSAVLVQF